ncbi:MAG: hypothetical protein ACYDG2_17445 [Ruminiclostridium sp.]
MDNILYNNDLIKNLVTDITERILWNSSSLNYLYSIELFTNKLIINKKAITDIEKGLEEGVFTILPDDTKLKVLNIDELNESRKELLENRYKIVKVIDNDENIPYCYERGYRGKLIKKAVEKYDVAEKTVYQYIRKFWQGGRTIDSLYDDYDNCGRNSVKNYTKKPGRKSAAERLSLKRDKDHIGFIVDKQAKEIFYKGYVRYIKNNADIALSKAFDDIKTDNYREKSWNQKPTYEQFYYWFRNNINMDENEKFRKGKKNYQNNVRGLTSDTIFEADGPGFRYQVDSTIFPIYLVNRIDRTLIVGRPVVYFAVDVYSTIITGAHVTLFSESWDGYASLLFNAIEDKMKYCRAFGKEITSDEWIVKGSPKVVLGDRGGFISKHSDLLIEKLDIGFEIAPSFSGSSKGNVEKKFDIIEQMLKHELPGIIKVKYRERGGTDYRKDAKLDLYEFTQIVIETVLERNEKIMKDYPLEKELVWAAIEPSANNIFKWAISRKSGALRSQSEEKLRFYLLRHGTASITHRGIKYGKMHYTCKIAQEENWFSRINKAQTFEIAFDSRCLNTILLHDEKNMRFIECEINRQLTSNSIYIDRSLEEIESYDENVLARNMIYTDKNDESSIKHKDNRDKIT